MSLPQQKRKMLGEMLIAEGLLTAEQLDHALAEQRRHGGRIGAILKGLGYVTEEGIIKTLGRQTGIPHQTLSTIIIDADVIKLVPELLARRHQAIPLYKKGETLTLAMVDPLNVVAVDDIARVTGLEIQPVVSTEQDVMRAIERQYGMSSTIEEAVKNLEPYDDRQDAQSVQMERLAEETPVVKFVATIITQAVHEGASDIHIEPDPEVLRVRHRVDGLLREITTAPKGLQGGVLSRIKIMAGMDISEKRAPQDGRIEMKVGERDIDLRVSTLPTIHGEKVVLRILDKRQSVIKLSELGFPPSMYDVVHRLVERPHGLFLVTGPTGGGKTTTLCAALNTINTMARHIVTIEDPVEYQMKIISQVQVNPKAGVTFANGLRSILRQDPDVIMVGEIRDRETATIAIQAALTGHLVLSTLHTNDAPSAVARLIDIGVEPFLIASSLLGVIAQRLVRKVCLTCQKPEELPQNVLKGLVLEASTVKPMKGVGCTGCRNTGYSGRIGIFELLTTNDALRELIVDRASASRMKAEALRAGYVPLRQAGLAKVAVGLTTLEEVYRVTQEVDGE
ncbi:MAG: Flp pilus assembly complex ATPase component TadA [Nitrospirae bacterium]|nr:Flp pilus assembly complex ATPase component TadA [Nitrospirota bacterium]